MCVNILWQVGISKAFYKVAMEPGKAAQLCVYFGYVVPLPWCTYAACLGLGMRYTYSSLMTRALQPKTQCVPREVPPFVFAGPATVHGDSVTSRKGVALQWFAQQVGRHVCSCMLDVSRGRIQHLHSPQGGGGSCSPFSTGSCSPNFDEGEDVHPQCLCTASCLVRGLKNRN